MLSSSRPRGAERSPHDGAVVIWALVDGIVGSANQTRGVVAALKAPSLPGGLGASVLELRVDYARERLWDRVRKHVVLTTDTQARVMEAHPPPRLVVSCGRRAGAAARWIAGALHARDGMRPRLLHIQDPRVGHAAFDLIAIPSHDRAVARLRRRSNVLVTVGAPHGLTRDRLTAEAAGWWDRVVPLPRPWITVLVGGDSGRRRLDGAVAATLARQASALAARAGGSLLVTTSRRTRPDALAALRTGLRDSPHILHAWTPEGAGNPYLGFLGLADAVVVTGDSMSMLSEATTSGGPVYVFSPPGWARTPHARFHAALETAGAARPLAEDTPWAPWAGVEINPAGEIARAVQTLLTDAEVDR